MHGGGDDRVLLLLEHIGHSLGQLRRLPVQPRELGTGLRDLLLELRHRFLLLGLEGYQLRQLRVELVPLDDLLVACRLFRRALLLELRQVSRERRFEVGCA